MPIICRTFVKSFFTPWQQRTRTQAGGQQHIRNVCSRKDLHSLDQLLIVLLLELLECLLMRLIQLIQLS